MNIKDVKMNFIRASEIVKYTGKAKKLLMSKWCVDGETQNNKSARIYIITSNGEIKKIGASNSKDGIKSTMGLYENANANSSSISRFGVQKMILAEIEKGKKVEVYVRFTENVEINVKGLVSEKRMMVSISSKDIEDVCKEDYFNICGNYPDWNYQENNKPWPNYMQKAFSEYKRNYRKNTQRKNR